MKNLKKIILVSTLVLLISSCSKEKGCTDKNADNYNPSAEINNGDCNYSGQVVFWFNQDISTSLVLSSRSSLTYYIDEVVVGSTATNVYWNGAPSCGQNGSITVTKDLGIATNLSANFKVVDNNGAEVWKGVVNFTANTCVKYELTE